MLGVTLDKRSLNSYMIMTSSIVVTCNASIKFSQASYLRLQSEMILLKCVYTFW